jgi:hypothetical protein
MSNYFEECLASCQDGRLAKVHLDIIEKIGFGKVDQILFGNPILDLVEPKYDGDKFFTLGKFKISIVHHQVRVVKLYNHFDCGYYKIRDFAFNSKNQEKELLTLHLDQAEVIIKENFPKSNFEVEKYLLDECDGNWSAERI